MINYPLKKCLRHSKVASAIQSISVNKTIQTIHWIVIYLLDRVIHLLKHPGKILTHWLLSFLPKMHSWGLFNEQFSAWKWSKLVPMYSITWQHAFFPLLLDFCSGLHKSQTLEFFWVRKWPTSLNFLGFLFFFCFCSFLILLQQWLRFYWACF